MTSQRAAAQGRMVLWMISGIGLLLTAAGAALLGVMLATQLPRTASWPEAVAVTTPAFVLLLAGVLVMVLPWMVWAIHRQVMWQGLEGERRYEQVMNALDQQRQLLQAVHDAGLLSEGAKAIAFRERDRAALRKAIGSASERGNYDDARQLVDEMQQRLGYLEEGEDLRRQVDAAEDAARQREIHDTVGHIDTLISQRQWVEAVRQADWLVRRYPEDPEATEQPRKIQRDRDAQKRTLLKEWEDSLASDDVDRSVVLLKELDQYLTPSEGEAYKDAARDVFRKRLQQLGAQFALHWHDQHYPEALKVARQIVDEFPNTRMAAEVRERMAVLEARAQQTEGAGV